MKRLQYRDIATPHVFPYYVAEVSDTFATMEFARTQPIHNFVDLVIQCTSVEERTKQDENKEPYLVMHGIDNNGDQAGPLRLWRFDESNASQDGIYIVRGLKVATATKWSDDVWKYVPWLEGPKTLECNNKTALEDVTHVSAIASFFE